MTDPRANKKQNWNYEATVAKVEKIINQLESGELELAEVFTEFRFSTCKTGRRQLLMNMSKLL